MAPKIPKSFGIARTGGKGPQTKKDETQSQKAPISKLTPPVPSLKRKDATVQPPEVQKKSRKEDAPSDSRSLALAHVGALASAFVRDEDIREWQAMSLDESTKACIKASAQLVFHSTHSIEKMVNERARLTKLEGENSILERKLKENDLSYQKSIKSKDADISFLNKEIKEQEEMISVLNEKFDKQEAEVKEMKARLQYLEDQRVNGWPDEKLEIADDNFARGFNFYLVGFMANDPDYTFEKFGEETVAEMAEYKKENAEAIRKRRIELRLEDPEGAPSDEEPETEIQAGDKVTQSSKFQTSTQDAPPDGATISPLQTLDASQDIPLPSKDAP